MTKKLSPLSPAETEILSILWQLGKASVGQIAENLPADRKITYATVQTLLRRLEKKGYLKHQTQGKAHIFFPSTEKDGVITTSVGDFVQRLFGGDAIPLVQHLAEHGQITSEDIDKLKKLINNKKSRSN
jgi:BlaI family penicillinase repressor